MAKTEYEAHLKNLPQMILFIRDEAKRCGFDRDQLHSIELACEEALVNIVRHGYSKNPGRINLSCRNIFGKGIEIIITDQGIPFNPLNNVKTPAKPLSIESQEIGGYGIFLILQLMDKVKYQRKKDYNSLTLIKYF
jgi:serine/threonine-protein kinase RsbW